MSKRFVTLLFGLVSLAGIGSGWAEGKTQLTIESWRNDDSKIWRDVILPPSLKSIQKSRLLFADGAHRIQRGSGCEVEGGYGG